jgi:Rrf2 family protein
MKFSRTAEYALLALEHMVRKDRFSDEAVSVREIGSIYHIPQNLLAKVMQKLAREKMVEAVRGVKGGYLLRVDVRRISVARIITIFDGPTSIAQCLSAQACPQADNCLIQSPFADLNEKINNLLEGTSIADLAGPVFRSPKKKLALTGSKT